MTRYRYVLTAVALAVSQLAAVQSAISAEAGSTNTGEPTSVPAAPVSDVPAAAAAAPAPVAAAETVPAVAPSPAPVSAPAMPATGKVDASRSEASGSEPRIIRGNDRVIAPPKPVPALTGAPITFNFEEAPVADVVRVILGDVLKVDYALHPPLAGTVTLTTRTPVSPDQAVFLLESALQANGILMVRDVRGTYQVGRPDAVKGLGTSARQVDKGSLPPGQGVIIVPLQYIGAGEMAAILKPLMPSDALIRVDNIRNLLVLAGTRTQAEGWLDLVSTFDVDLLKGMSVGVFPLKYASIAEVEAALRMMTPGATAAAAAATSTAGLASGVTAPATAGGSTAGRATSAPVGLGEGNPLFGALRILPIERLNSILVVTPRAAYLDEARLWIERLDRPNDNSTEPQLFVYPVQNGNARHLATVLSGIFGDGRQSGSTGTSGVAPGLNQTSSLSNSSTLNRSAGASLSGQGASSLSGGLNQTQNQAQAASVTAVNLVSGVRLIADEINNAILVYASRREFNKIESTLKRLDIPPTQVLIEASIIEVTLTDNLSYGLQWAFSNKGSNGSSGLGVLSTVAGGTLGAAAAGFSYTFKNSAGDVRAVLNALADKSLVNVISSPSLMVLDNHTANILVGDQTPVKTGDTSYVSGSTAVTSTYQYKDTGVSLGVTPSVNAGNMVTMMINQSVTDVGQVDVPTGQRAFMQRQISSKVAVRSGETIVLGGLIRDNSTKGSSGLPILGDLPLIGGLFGAQTRNAAKTELLVVITPKVVRSDQEIRDVSAELRDRMKGLSRMVESSGATPFTTPGKLSAPSTGFAAPASTPAAAPASTTGSPSSQSAK